MQAYTALIDVNELQAGQGRDDWRVIDCRFDLFNPAQGREDYRAGHIPGAVYAHLDDDLAAPVSATSGRHPLPAPDTFVATLRRLGISNGEQVVAYDGAGGGFAARLWWMLRWLGHERVAVLDGGFAAWKAADLPVATGEHAPPPGDFSGAAREGWVLDTAELWSRLRADDMPILVDAREPARFDGREEPIDTRAGHIPGAINFPFALNIDERGRWRRSAQLAAAWQECLGGPPPAGWAVMCGSGVTACHLALSAARAGLPPPRLYAGSWSEWIRDPARPVIPAAGGAADGPELNSD